MKLFKSKTLHWWEVGVIKLTVLCFGIAIGAKFSYLFISHLLVIVLIGIVLACYALYIWLKD